MKFQMKFHSFFKKGKNMKKVLTKFIILETIILLIVLFLITKNYFSNNTIWNLIIHDDQEETLLYENKDSLSNVIVKIYKVEHLSLFDMDIRVDVIFNKLEKYSYTTRCYSYENLDFNNEQDVNVKWQNHIPSIYIRNHPTITIKAIK